MQFHKIRVIDKQTRRGVPCVELKTTDARIFYTDSMGVVAFGEPDLLGKRVFFSISSFGYNYPANAFGQHATEFRTTPGEESTIEVERINIAQRLYRVTGSGIYRDSVLLGDKVPPNHEEYGNPEVMPLTGMDTVHSTIYKGKMFHLWGDTSISATPLGNFKTTSAVSDLPGKGGLDPEEGINLRYFRSNEWPYVKSMVNAPEQPIWLGGLSVGIDEKGEERLFAYYEKVSRGMGGGERGVVEFDDANEVFQIATVFPPDAIFRPNAMDHALKAQEGGVDYFYHSLTFPDVRVRTDAASIRDLSTYEAFTCLKPGSRSGSRGRDAQPAQGDTLERDAKGELVWGWKKDTSPLSDRALQRMVESGAMQPDEARFRLMDTNTTRSITPQSGSVFWNDYRQRFVCIRSETFGQESYLGEIWYFEGDTVLGPWAYGQKVVTHGMGPGGEDQLRWRQEDRNSYSFYNPTQHPEFDKEGGRIIYFEGTYTSSFSGAKFQTPLYDYNQIMYRLELDDPRLFVPVPVYAVQMAGEGEGEAVVYRTKNNLPEDAGSVACAFHAPDRPRPGTVAVYEAPGKDGGSARLSTIKPEGEAVVAFYAVAADAPTTGGPSPLVNLYEFTNKGGAVRYSVEEKIEEKGFERSEKPVCRVWPNRVRFDPLGKGLASGPAKGR